MSISNDKKKHYRSIGHSLNPVVTIAGNGLSEGVMAELQRALNDHELIKVKVAISDRDARKEVVQAMTSQCGAELIQEIGKVALIYKEAKNADPNKTNIR